MGQTEPYKRSAKSFESHLLKIHHHTFLSHLMLCNYLLWSIILFRSAHAT